MPDYGYPSREPTFDDYYRSVPRSGAEPPLRETRHTVEEMYARGRSNRSPPGKGYRRYDDDDSSDDEVQYRRQARRDRAWSASTERPQRRTRRSSVGPKGGELVRYESRNRGYDRPEYSDDGADMSPSDHEAAAGVVQHSRKPCGPHCAEKPVIKLPPAFRTPQPDEDYDSEEDEKERKKRRNKRRLYTGLATVGTLATANGLYQNHKAFKARRSHLDTTKPECAAEAAALKRKIIMQDLFAVAVVGIGVNNVRLAWARQQALKKEDQEAAAKWEDHRARRRSFAADGGDRYSR